MGCVYLSTYQMEELSSHGYIVVSVEHPFTASGTVFNDGSKGNIIPYEKMENEEYGNAMVDKWTSDHISTLDFLEKINRDPGNPFFEKMDLGRIGILGYSFGGATATNTLVVDKRH